jgi:hypothetical protein
MPESSTSQVSAIWGSLRTYRYNGKGERVSKTIAAGNTSNRYYTYDESGYLVGEYLAVGLDE